jgi:hypothetical protein
MADVQTGAYFEGFEAGKAAATAIWNEAVERCIETLELGKGLIDTPPTRKQEFESTERAVCIRELRSLKRSDKENGDG